MLFGATDLGAHDIGDAYLQASEESAPKTGTPGGCAAPPVLAQQCVRDIARLPRSPGPPSSRLDQIDTLLAQTLASTDGTPRPAPATASSSRSPTG